MLLSPSLPPIHQVHAGGGGGSSPGGSPSFSGHHLSPPRDRLPRPSLTTHQSQKQHHLPWITSTLVPPLSLQGELRITTPPLPFRPPPKSNANNAEEVVESSTSEGGNASLSSTSTTRGPGAKGRVIAAGEPAFHRPSQGRGSPVSPTAGGQSILTMLLERERSDSIASGTTITAQGGAISAERSGIQQPCPSTIGECRDKGEKSAGFWSRSGSTPLSGTPPSDEAVTSRETNAQTSNAPQQPKQEHGQEENRRLIFPTSSPATITPPPSGPADGHRRGMSKKSSRWRQRMPDEEEGRIESAEVDVTTPLLLGRHKQQQQQQKPASYGGTESPTETDSTSSPPTHILYATSAALENHASLSPSHHYSPTTSPSKEIAKLLHATKQYASPKALGEGVVTTLQTLPSVMLGLLLNILDGVSYGFIIFPAGPIFGGFGSMGVSMFFVTCVYKHCSEKAQADA